MRGRSAILSGVQLEADGARLCEIARALGRSSNSILGRLATLARIETRAEETLHG